MFAPTALVPRDFYQRADELFASLNVLQSYDRFDMWLFNQDDDILEVQTGFPRSVGLVYKFRGMYGYLITRGGILKLLPHMLPANSRVDAKISYAVRAYDIKVVHTRALTVRHPSVEEFFTEATAHTVVGGAGLLLFVAMLYLAYRFSHSRRT